MTDPRVVAVRKRLAVTGELRGDGAARRPRLRPRPADGGQELPGAPSAHRRRRDRRRHGGGDERDARTRGRRRSASTSSARAGSSAGSRDSSCSSTCRRSRPTSSATGKNVWETRTQIGREARKTPTFRADMKYLVLNPDWTVPPTILAQDVLAGMKKGQNTIAQEEADDPRRPGPRGRSAESIDWQAATPRNFRYTLRQPPGADNALGRVNSSSRTSTRSSCTTRRARSCSPPTSARSARAASASRNALDLARVLLDGSSDRRGTRQRIAARSSTRQPQTVVLRRSAAGADRLLDGVDRRRRRSAVRERRLRPRRAGAARTEHAR